MADTADPIRVGESTTYIVTVTNDREIAALDVSLTFFLPDGLDFVRFDSGGLPLDAKLSPNRRSVGITPIQVMRVGETLRPLRLEVRATRPGLQQLRVEVTTRRIQEPVVKVADTTVQAN